jgi:hypothetical protein
MTAWCRRCNTQQRDCHEDEYTGSIFSFSIFADLLFSFETFLNLFMKKNSICEIFMFLFSIHLQLKLIFGWKIWDFSNFYYYFNDKQPITVIASESNWHKIISNQRCCCSKCHPPSKHILRVLRYSIPKLRFKLKTLLIKLMND